MCARQLQRREEDLEEASLHLWQICLEGKERHNNKYSICIKEQRVGQVVFLHNTRRKKDMSRKLAFKWLGPYKISNTIKDKDIYMLKKLDGLQLAGTFAGYRLKKFYLWQ